MESKRLQEWIQKNASRFDHVSLDYGVARLLTQTGQLGEAVLNHGDVAKELADVAFVIGMIANRSKVDIGSALEQHLYSKTAEEFIARLDKR